jgi:hypothetical protein
MTSKQFFKTLILFFSFVFLDQAFAKDTLWLSDIRTGDCVTDRIQGNKTSFNRDADRQYCINGNVGDAEKIKICQQNSTYTDTIVFFTNRCSEEYYLGLNGTEHTLKKLADHKKYYTPLIGKFYGKGLKVEVKSLRLSSKEYEEGTKNVLSGTYDVLVIVQKGSTVKKFNGVLGFGP